MAASLLLGIIWVRRIIAGCGKYIKLILICTLVIGFAFTLLFELAPNAVARLFGQPTNIPNPEDYWVFAEKNFASF